MKYQAEKLSVLMVKQLHRIQQTLNVLKFGVICIGLTLLFQYMAFIGWFGS
jgi:hypothetical protein